MRTIRKWSLPERTPSFLTTVILVAVLVALASSTPAQVRIHEFIAKNTAGIRDEQNELEDWVEFLNAGATAVDLSGYHLTDDLTRLAKWRFPTGTVIPAGGTLLIWADEDGKDGPYHANFKLDKDGEELALVATDGITVIDSVKFGLQTADVSTGRVVGHNVWMSFPNPTPRAANQPTPCGNLMVDALNSSPNPGGSMEAVSGPKVGATAQYRVSNAAVSTAGFFALSTLPFQARVGSYGSLLVNPAGMVLLPIGTNSAGVADFKLPVPAASVLAGATFYVQAFVHDGQTGGLTSALITRICP